MRRLTTTAVGTVELEAGPEPVPGPGEALLAIESVGICGSDIHMYTGSHPYSRFPNVQGHEFGGRVLSLPHGYAGPIRVGQLVAVEPLIMCGECLPCRRGRGNACLRMRTYGIHVDGALADRLAVRVDLLHDAEGLPPELVPLVETMSIALQGAGRAAIGADDRVVVYGAGPIGLGLLIAATRVGASVMLVDTLAPRLALARELGAAETAQARRDDVPAAVEAWTGGDGPTVVAEATGVPSVLEEAIATVAPTGTVLVVGLSRETISFPMVELTRKELTIVGSRNSIGRFASAVELVRAERERVERLVSHRFPLEEGSRAFALAHDEPAAVEKVIIDIGARGR